MRKLVVLTFVSLDGVMQAPGGPEEDPSGGFKYGGWSVNYWDDVMSDFMRRTMSVPFDLLLGRRTYEIFAAHWPHAGDQAAAGPLNGATKYVASRTLKDADLTWSNSRLLKGNVATAIARLKKEDGPELQVHGSGNLIQTLLAHDLIDEFQLKVFPLVLGKGKRLFGEGTQPRNLSLAETKTTTTGVTISVYRPAGEVETGSFALETPSEAELKRRQKAT